MPIPSFTLNHFPALFLLGDGSLIFTGAGVCPISKGACAVDVCQWGCPTLIPYVRCLLKPPGCADTYRVVGRRRAPELCIVENVCGKAPSQLEIERGSQIQ